jgi:hypothetical protein
MSCMSTSLIAIGTMSRERHSRKRDTGEVAKDSAAVQAFLSLPAFEEDEAMEAAHVRDEQLHGERRLRMALINTLVNRAEHTK